MGKHLGDDEEAPEISAVQFADMRPMKDATPNMVVAINQLKRQDRHVINAGELSSREIDAIQTAQVPAQFAELDNELKDWKP